MYKLYNIIYRTISTIATKADLIADYYYYKCERILEAKYNKDVIDFYENGIGYYKHK